MLHRYARVAVGWACRTADCFAVRGRGQHTAPPWRSFERLGLPSSLCQQVHAALPHVDAPTPTQAALIPAMLKPQDVILRAHTGSGKSFAVLLSLLARPRMLFRSGDDGTTPAVSALVLVPSNELAHQYMRWAHELMPHELGAHMDAVIQCVVRGGGDADSIDARMDRLRRTPPHIIVATPTRLAECLATGAHGAHVLGVYTWRTLVLDEADALLRLPGRFPSEKQRWKHLVHPTPGLHVLDTIMQKRATYSGGERILTAGLERYAPAHGADKRPPEHVRRTQYRGAERASNLAAPRARTAGSVPLQLVCTSATANAVLRHFFGARTGWLRTNTRETRDAAQWIDMTGMSGRISSVDAPASGIMPREISHSCVVVDEKAGMPEMRALDTGEAVSEHRSAPPSAPPSSQPAHELLPEHVVDSVLVETLAYIYASQGIHRALALIPARWSVRRVYDELAALGVPVRLVAPDDLGSADEEALYVLQSTSARGLDLPNLSHVLLLGIHAVPDAIHYTHVAGRVARVGAHGVRPPGHVVTLLRRHAPSEQKMARMYKRVGVRPVPLPEVPRVAQ